MANDGLERRQFMQSLVSVPLGSILPSSTEASMQQTDSDSERPGFGTSIGKLFSDYTTKEETSLGSINDESLFVSYQSWNQGGETSESTITKLNRFTGKAEWSKTIDNYVYSPTESEGHLYFADNGSVFCWESDTGEELWRQSLRDDLIEVSQAGEKILVRGFDFQEFTRDGERVTEITGATLYALDPETGDINWRHSANDGIWSALMTEEYVVFRKNETYLTDSASNLVYESGQVIAVEKSDGNIAWRSDSINPQALVEQNGILATPGDNGIYLFTLSGEQVLHYSRDISTYFVTDELLLIGRQEGGLWIFDHSGSKITEEPLHSESHISNIRSGSSADPFVLVTDDNYLKAIDGSSYEQLWRTNHQASLLSIQYEIGFVSHNSDQITAFDLRTGDQIWSEELHDNDSIRMRIYDGVLYIYGESTDLHAYSGQRGRALAALNRIRGKNAISGTVSNYIPGSDYLSEAEAAVEAGRYERVHQLIDKEQRQRMAIDGMLSVVGLGAVYTTGRIGTSTWQQRRLATAIDDIESSYPIEKGAIARVNPTDLIAQAQTAHGSLDSKTKVPIRQAVSDDYRELIQTLTYLVDRYPDLVEASEYLASIDQTIFPDSWISDLKSAVKHGNIQTIDGILTKITNVEETLDQLQSLMNTIESSSFSVSPDQFHRLVEQEISGTDKPIDGVDLNNAFEAIETSIGAVEDYRDSLETFDLVQKRKTIQSALQCPKDISTSKIRELRAYPDLLEVATEVEAELAQINFDSLGASSANFVAPAETAFAQSDIQALRSIAEDLKQMRIGEWSRSDLFTVSPIEFEYLVAALFADMGYQVSVTDQQGDKGVDVIARNGAEVLVIQVKQHSRGNRVGRPTVQQIIGAMAQAGADRAVIVSSARFTKTAIEASRELGNVIELIDGGGLVQLLTESSLHPQGGASEYKSYARSSKTSESRSRSSQRNSYATSNNKSLDEEDAYEILDIDPPASQSEIQSQYREKVKTAHPDTGGSTEEFKEVKQAYNVLSED